MPKIAIPRKSLSESVVSSLRWTGKTEFHGDTKLIGFSAKTTRGGVVFVVQAELKDGSKRNVRKVIGRYGELTVTEARERAKVELQKIHEGIHPTEVKKQAKLRQEALRQSETLTFGKVLQDYISEKELKESTKKSMLDHCHRCLAAWVNMPIGSITEDMVKKRHHEMSNLERHDGDGRPKSWSGLAQADNAMTYARALFNFAMVEYKHLEIDGKPIVSSNPIKILSHKSKGRGGWNKVDRRQGIIEDYELKSWYKAVMSLSNPSTRDYLRLLLFTGLRRKEASNLKWSNVNFRIDDKSTFTIRDTKNGSDHTLPMTKIVYDIFLERWQHRVEGNEYVFPGQKEGQPIVDPYKSVLSIEKAMQKEFCLHDLRRTFATAADSKGLSLPTIKRLTNHKMKDVTVGYIVPSVDKLREPLESVNKYMLDIINKADSDDSAIVIQFDANQQKRNA